MSWVDVISQALGAGAQGVAGHEQVVRQRKQVALQEMEQQRAAKDLEFRQIERSINPGAPIDPVMLPKIAEYGLTSRVKKGPDGSAIWADTLDDTRTREDIRRLTALGDEAGVKAQVAAKEATMRDSIINDPEGYMAQPDIKRSVMWQGAGFNGPRPQSMEELIALKRADDETALEVARIRAANDNQPRPVDPTRQALNQAQLQKIQAENLLTQMGGIVQQGMIMFPGQKNQNAARAAYQQALQGLAGGQQQQQAPAPGAAPQGGGIAPGTKRVINGVNAVWDGQGWLPQ